MRSQKTKGEKSSSLHHFHFILLLLQGSRLFRYIFFPFHTPMELYLVPDEKWGFLFCTPEESGDGGMNRNPPQILA